MLRAPCTPNPAIKVLQFALPRCQKAAGILWYEQRAESGLNRAEGGTSLGNQTAATHKPHPPQAKPTVISCYLAEDPTSKTPAWQHFSAVPWQGQGSILAPPQRADFQHGIGIGSLVWGRALPWGWGCALPLPTSVLMNLVQSLFQKQIYTCHTQAQLLTLGKKPADI